MKCTLAVFQYIRTCNGNTKKFYRICILLGKLIRKGFQSINIFRSSIQTKQSSFLNGIKRDYIYEIPCSTLKRDCPRKCLGRTVESPGSFHETPCSTLKRDCPRKCLGSTAESLGSFYETTW